jgi:hypothetical protein
MEWCSCNKLCEVKFMVVGAMIHEVGETVLYNERPTEGLLANTKDATLVYRRLLQIWYIDHNVYF